MFLAGTIFDKARLTTKKLGKICIFVTIEDRILLDKDRIIYDQNSYMQLFALDYDSSMD